jgi:hypothetical protein
MGIDLTKACLKVFLGVVIIDLQSPISSESILHYNEFIASIVISCEIMSHVECCLFSSKRGM